MVGYLYGGNTGVKSAAELAREREIVDALISRGQKSPQNLGEGLSALGQAIASRVKESRLAKDEAAGKAAGSSLMSELFPQPDSPTITPQSQIETGPLGGGMSTYQPEPSLAGSAYPTSGPETPPGPADWQQGDMAQAQPVPEPMPSATPFPKTEKTLEHMNADQLTRMMADPRFEHMPPMVQQMVTDRYKTMADQNDPYKQQQLKNAQLEYEQKLHPDKIPLTALQQAQVSKLTTPDTSSQDEANQISDSIISGDQPPDLTGLYRQGSHVRAALARKGYNLTNAKEDWAAQQKYIATLNGPQQVRLRQAVDFAFHSLPIIKGLAQEWKAGQYPALNSVELEAAKHGALGQDAQRIATQLSSQIADMTSELGTVYKGGNSSTDESLRLAGENLKANWSEETLLAGIELVGKNLQIRRNSINSGSPMGAGARYRQEPAPYDAPAEATAPAAAGGLPEGWTQEEFDVLTPEEKKELTGQ